MTVSGKKWAPVLLLLLAVLLAYANVYDNAFLYDDEFLIQKNQLLRSWENFPTIFQGSSTAGALGTDSFYRPLQGALYLLVYQLTGLETWGYHLLNILIHLGNTLLVFGLLQRLRFTRGVAFTAALLWSLHPLHTEAVTYMSATADPLHAFFVLLGMYILAAGTSARRMVLAFGCFMLAILGKESGIIFPAVLIAVLYRMNPDREWKWRTYLPSVPFWLGAGVYLILRKTVLNFDDTFHFYKTANLYTENLGVRVWTFLSTLPNYLKILIAPLGLHMDREYSVYPSPLAPDVILGALMFAGAVALLFIKRWRSTPWPWAVLWFYAAHAPHTGVLMPVNSFFLEHWMYVPSIAFFALIASTAADITSNRPFARYAAIGGATLVAFVLGALTWRQNEVWETPITFYSNILKHDPNVARVHNNLAMAYSDQQQYRQAEMHYRRAIELRDDYPQTYHNLALLKVRENNLKEARALLEKSVEVDPQFFQSYLVLAQIYQAAGENNKAQATAQKAQEIIHARSGR